MSNWLHAVNGNFNSKHDWGPHKVPGAADDAILDAKGAAFTVTATTNEDVNSIQTTANATLLLKGDPAAAHTFRVENGTGAGVNLGTIKIGDNTSLQLAAQIGKSPTYFVNSGSITLNATMHNAFLDVQSYNGGGGSLRLSGGGSIVMGDSAFNGIVDTLVSPSESVFIDNVDNRISGGGVIGDGGLPNGAAFGFENASAGVIDATGSNSALIIDVLGAGSFANFSNAGLIEGTGKAGLDIASTIMSNRGGTIFAGAASIVRLESSTIEGGTLSSAGTGIVLASGGSTLDGITVGSVTNSGVLQVFGESLYAVGSIVNTGAIKLSDQVTGAILKINSGIALSGGGTLTLTDNFQNGIQGYGAGGDLFNADNTISGAGTVGGTGLNVYNQVKGVIDATGTYNPLIVGTSGMTFKNSGMMRATGKAGLDMAGITLDQSGGGTLASAAGSIVRLESANIIGGTLTNAAGGQIEASGGSTMAGTTIVNQGLFTVVEADTFSASGTIGNSGTLSLAGTSSGARLLASGALQLNGGGTVLLGAGGAIDSAASADTVTNLDDRILGDGELGGGAALLVNAAGGTIRETGTSGLLIDAVKLGNAGIVEAAGAGDISVLSTVTNSGLIQADTGSMLSLTAAVANSGVLEANGGTLIAYQAVTGAGSAKINGGTLQFARSFNEAVSFTGGGRLDLARSQTYTATITGFSASGATSLDLGDIKFVSAGEASFSGTASSGVLTVSDGVHTAKIQLAGNYLSSSFVASKDGSGGVVVKATAAALTAPHGFIAAMAGFGADGGGAMTSCRDQTHAAAALVALPRAGAT